MVVKEGNTDMGTKPNIAKEAITPPIAKRRLTHSTKKINHNNPIKKKIHPAAINMTKEDNWMNLGLIKELTHKNS